MASKMLVSERPLTPAQRKWVESAIEGEKYEPEIKYSNMVSSGKASSVSTVELLVKDHPIKPPGRR
jgi:hypothetical protein